MDNITTIDSDKVCPANDKDKKCVPGVSFEAGSCIKINVLIEMAIAYNKENSKSPIQLHHNYEILNPRKYKKYLLNEFNKRIGDKCTTQHCWSQQSFIKHMQNHAKQELKKFTFRPTGPEGQWEWLNTLHINDVMNQYEDKYPDFQYLGTVPIDFDDFEKMGIVNIKYDQLIKSGKSRLGIIFNLDEHDQPGSHWVAMFSDLKKGQIYFFDSYGTRPERRIRTLMRRHATFCIESLKIPEDKLDVDYNKVRHQYENSECGVYSINFILRLLRGDTFEQICKSKVHDRKINRCRNVYFSNVNIKKDSK